MYILLHLKYVAALLWEILEIYFTLYYKYDT